MVVKMIKDEKVRVIGKKLNLLQKGRVRRDSIILHS